MPSYLRDAQAGDPRALCGGREGQAEAEAAVSAPTYEMVGGR